MRNGLSLFPYFKRTFMIFAIIVIALSLPITVLVLKNSQDIRQFAQTDNTACNRGRCDAGFACVNNECVPIATSPTSVCGQACRGRGETPPTGYTCVITNPTEDIGVLRNIQCPNSTNCVCPTPTFTPTPTQTPSNCSSTTGRPDLCACDITSPNQCAKICTQDITGSGSHCCAAGTSYCQQNGQCVTSSSQCLTGGTTLTISATLLGIGQALGDNRQPRRTSRSAELVVYNSQNTAVSNGTGTLVFDGTKYTGNILLASTVSNGFYYATVRMDNTLKKQTPGILALTSGAITTAPTLSLVTGDLNQDNTLNLADYNLFLPCFGASACTQKQLADLNDDGSVEEIDLNILQRNFSTRRGDGEVLSATTTREVETSATTQPTVALIIDPLQRRP